MAISVDFSGPAQLDIDFATNPAIDVDLWVEHSLGQHEDFDDSDQTAGYVITRQADGTFAMAASGGGGGGATAFTDLDDTPTAYSGSAGKVVAVNGSANGLEFVTGSGAVSSVFSRTGAVVAAASDYIASQVDNDSDVAGADVKEALNQLDSEITALVTGVSSVFGRSGAVVAAALDYAASQVNNDSGVTGSLVSDALDTLNTGKADTSHTHAASDVVSGTFADARVSQTSVTQHQAAIDHGSIAGLGDDDHTQYVLADGTRQMTTLDVAGNITVGGTVDTRDIAADGSKLDGIETGATADQTAGEIEAIVNHDNLLGFVAAEHFTEASIDHVNIQNVGSKTHAQIDSHIDATAAHGATGEVVGTTNTQTLTNKTLTTPVIGDYTNATHDHEDAAGGGNLTFDAITGLSRGTAAPSSPATGDLWFDTDDFVLYYYTSSGKWLSVHRESFTFSRSGNNGSLRWLRISGGVIGDESPGWHFVHNYTITDISYAAQSTTDVSSGSVIQIMQSITTGSASTLTSIPVHSGVAALTVNDLTGLDVDFVTGGSAYHELHCRLSLNGPGAPAVPTLNNPTTIVWMRRKHV